MKKKILIVEDDIDIKQIVRKHFESYNVEVIDADNGKAAIELIEKSGLPNLIITDVKMPVMDGIEFSRILREKYGNNIPLVFLSEKRNIDDKISGFDAGAVNYITKPFQISKLMRVVNGLLYDKEHYSIEMLEHYENFYTFKISTNNDCVKEVSKIIVELINKLEINVEEKYKITNNINTLLSTLHSSEDDIENNRYVTISYFISEDTISLIIESEEESVRQNIQKFIENFEIDFKIDLKNNYIKISKKFDKEKI
ncbi:response regulator transcription factor [Candidatus Dependentiae bacterium]|nr:response regulator transcription factor [Candidatus Dependentiae bacterium]